MRPTKSDSPCSENTQGRHYTLKSTLLAAQLLDLSVPARQIDSSNRTQSAQVGLRPAPLRRGAFFGFARQPRATFGATLHFCNDRTSRQSPSTKHCFPPQGKLSRQSSAVHDRREANLQKPP